MNQKIAAEKLALDRQAAVREVLSKPVVLDMTDYVAKIRQNLMIAATVTIAILFFGIQVADSQSLFGLTLEKLSTQKLKIGLLAINAYMLIHFVWLMIDGFKSWRIRLTGSGVLYGEQASYRNDDTDLVSDPRQSSLHNWWSSIASRFPAGASRPNLDKVIADLENYYSMIRIQEPNSSIADAIVGLNKNMEEIRSLRAELVLAKELLESPTPPIALERFDAAFRSLLKSQRLRWLVIEVGLPVALGTASVIRLSYEVFVKLP